METLAEHILTHVATLPEGQTLAAKGLLHLGERAAVDQIAVTARQARTPLAGGRGLYVSRSKAAMAKGLRKDGDRSTAVQTQRQLSMH